MERNFDFPAGGTSGGGAYIKVHPANAMGKTQDEQSSYFVMPTGEKVNFIQGYLDDIVIEDRDALTEHKIPKRTEYNLVMSLPDGNGGSYKATVTFSDHWKNAVTTAILNAMAGQNPAGWDYFVKISMYDKEGNARASVRGRDGDFLANAYPWQESQNGYGTPRATLEDGTVNTDYRPFWKGVAEFTQRTLWPEKYGTKAPVQQQTAKDNPATSGPSLSEATAKPFSEGVASALADKITGKEDHAAMQALCSKVSSWESAYRIKHGQGAIPATEQLKARSYILQIAENAGLKGVISQDWKWVPDTGANDPIGDDDLPF